MNEVEALAQIRVSVMAENLVGSEIIKLAAEINQRIRRGEKIYNLTIGDFDPHIFPIPETLRDGIIQAYKDGETNYPAANGIERLRKAVSEFIGDNRNLQYSPEEVLIAGGGRPLIYATYMTLLDPGDSVIYPVPSWNNNHYTHLSNARKIEIATRRDNHFMPVAEEIAPHLREATLLALCSPLNPTGTAFSREALEGICRMVLEENRRRAGEKPLYILYDQLYWMLTYGQTVHYDPVQLCPELRDYVIYIDGISKAFASTGVRVGWAFGPKRIIDKMRSILSHIGAWAPRAEQVATAQFLHARDAVRDFSMQYKTAIHDRLDAFYKSFSTLRAKGYPVDCIAPEAAIYLTVKIDLRNALKANGERIETMQQVTQYVLEEAHIGLVPFYAFGADPESPWFRLSIGTCAVQDVAESMQSLEQAMSLLRF